MKFHEWETLFEFARKQVTNIGAGHIPDDGWKELYLRFIAHNIKDGWLKTHDGALGIWRQQSELWWYEASRPYYKVWPAIQSALLNTNLGIKTRELELRDRSILIRFAVGHEPVKNAGAVLVSIRQTVDIATKQPDGNRSLVINWGEETDNTHKTCFIDLNDKTFEEAINEGAAAGQLDEIGTSDAKTIVRCVAMVVLLADDPSIITPDVLAKDRDRYDRETDEEWKQRAVDRARRRGVVGWNIGADYEVCPHYRRPHFGLRHTGKGGTVPRIVPIKGAIVHRSRLTEVPTGYMLPDGTEVEHGKIQGA